MSICGAASLGDFQGGASFFGRGGQVSTSGAHKCALEAGHDGPHAERSLSRLSDDFAMQTTYSWTDEHTLTAQVEIVPITTTIALKDIDLGKAGTR
jgi:hypothetical protein